MDSSPLSLYNALNEGQIIGPEHHRFKLLGNPLAHPLGKIWQAEDLSTTPTVHVSAFIIRPELTQQKSFINAFKKQIIQAKSLAHKHLLPIYGHFVHRGGLLFFTTEAIEGLSLASLISEKKVTQLKENQLRGLLLQLASAADAYLQKTRLAHGSIAPDCIFINKESGVRLLPLQPQLLLTEFAENTTLQFQYKAYQSSDSFDPDHKPLPADDIYTLAAIAYAVLTGNPAYTNTEEVDRITKTLKAPSQLDNKQWELLRNILAVNALNLPRSATDLIKALFEKEPPQPEVINESLPEGASNADSSPGKDASRIKIKINSQLLLNAGLFITGVVLGVFISLWYLGNQQLEMIEQTNRWKEQADIWKTTANDQMKTIALLNEKIANSAQTTTPTPAGQLPSTPPNDNFEHFKDMLQDGSEGPEMVSLPAGQFRMGDLNNLGDDNEKPIQTIALPTAFALSRYEVTFAQYDHYATLTGKKLPDDNGWGRGNQPVINVSWQDAKAYVNWLAKQTGQAYRLPSEAEWEYAARAGSDSAYWWGNELSPGRAVCDECGTEWDGLKPAPVGSTPPNPWGLNDLNGNVDEWVEDCYADSYQGYPSNGQARSLSRCEFRSMRGGSWFDIGRVIRSASRYRHPSEASRNTWGFRVALDLQNP